MGVHMGVSTSHQIHIHSNPHLTKFSCSIPVCPSVHLFTFTAVIKLEYSYSYAIPTRHHQPSSKLGRLSSSVEESKTIPEYVCRSHFEINVLARVVGPGW